MITFLNVMLVLIFVAICVLIDVIFDVKYEIKQIPVKMISEIHEYELEKAAREEERKDWKSVL